MALAFLAAQLHDRAKTLDRSRAQFQRGFLCHEFAPVLVVGIGKERRHRHLDEIGIAVEFFPVGIGEFGTLDQ